MTGWTPMANYIQLTKEQKNEIRRLTQFANRRILSAYERQRGSGMDVLPSEVTGDFQVKAKWHTDKTPISRSIKFTSQREYKSQLKMLQDFERLRPDIWTYTSRHVQRSLIGVETSLGYVPDDLKNRLQSMNNAQLTKFWNKFSNTVIRMGMTYSSESAMLQTMTEFFDEDIEHLIG